MLKISVVLLLVVVACATAGLHRVPLDVDDEEVKEIADKAAYAVNEKLPEQFHYKLVKITKALKSTTLDVFYLTLVMGETTCEKQEVTYEEAKQCDIKESARAYKKCRVRYSQEDTLMLCSPSRETETKQMHV